MAMSSSDLFLLRAGLVEAGMKEEAAEKVAVAMEGAVALTLDQVMEKWSSRMDARFEKIDARFEKVERDIEAVRVDVKHDMEIVKRDMTIRLGLMIFAAVGLVLSGIRLFM